MPTQPQFEAQFEKVMNKALPIKRKDVRLSLSTFDQMRNDYSIPDLLGAIAKQLNQALIETGSTSKITTSMKGWGDDACGDEIRFKVETLEPIPEFPKGEKEFVITAPKPEPAPSVGTPGFDKAERKMFLD